MSADETAPAAATGAALKRKVGGLPIGVWAVGAGVVIGLALLLRNRSVGGGAVDPGITTAGGTVSTAGNLAADDELPPDSSTVTIDQAPLDNDEWRLLALRRLLAGGYNPLVANAALSKWLDGETLTAEESAMVTAAITLAGPAPQAPIPPLPGTPAPVTPVTPRYDPPAASTPAPVSMSNTEQYALYQAQYEATHPRKGGMDPVAAAAYVAGARPLNRTQLYAARYLKDHAAQGIA